VKEQVSNFLGLKEYTKIDALSSGQVATKRPKNVQCVAGPVAIKLRPCNEPLIIDFFRIKIGLNSKMPARFPPVVFYCT
jgi:hypothetical protein